MAQTSIFARMVALIGDAAILWRRMQGRRARAGRRHHAGDPRGKAAGRIPTLKMPTARGWAPGQTPVAAPGLKVNAFATGLKHPRWIHVLPNGDVTVAEALFLPGPRRSVFDYAMVSTMKRAAAVGVSPNRITLLRDADRRRRGRNPRGFPRGPEPAVRHGAAGRHVLCRQHRRRGRLPLHAGATRITAPGRKLTAFKPGGHWTRSLLPSPDGRKLYVGVGSLSNIGDAAWKSRKAAPASTSSIWPAAAAASSPSGLRNPVGLAWEPHTGVLWTVVNERDGLGDETPPDYLTSVRDGGFYGWPYCYWGQTVDDRVPQDPADGRQGHHAGLRAGRAHRVARPLLAARRHAARLSRRHGHRPARLLEPQHAQRLQGRLRAVRERPPDRPAARHPDGLPRAGRARVLRPAGRRHDRPRSRSLLVADDVGDVIWRVTGA